MVTRHGRRAGAGFGLQPDRVGPVLAGDGNDYVDQNIENATFNGGAGNDSVTGTNDGTFNQDAL